MSFKSSSLFNVISLGAEENSEAIYRIALKIWHRREIRITFLLLQYFDKVIILVFHESILFSDIINFISCSTLVL